MNDRDRNSERGGDQSRERDGMSGSPGGSRDQNARPGGRTPQGDEQRDESNLDRGEGVRSSPSRSGSTGLGGPERKQGSSPGGTEGIGDEDEGSSRR